MRAIRSQFAALAVIVVAGVTTYASAATVGKRILPMGLFIGSPTMEISGIFWYDEASASDGFVNEAELTDWRFGFSGIDFSGTRFSDRGSLPDTTFTSVDSFITSPFLYDVNHNMIVMDPSIQRVDDVGTSMSWEVKHFGSIQLSVSGYDPVELKHINSLAPRIVDIIVPEPSTFIFALFGMGVLGMVMRNQRRKHGNSSSSCA